MQFCSVLQTGEIGLVLGMYDGHTHIPRRDKERKKEEGKREREKKEEESTHYQPTTTNYNNKTILFYIYTTHK